METNKKTTKIENKQQTTPIGKQTREKQTRKTRLGANKLTNEKSKVNTKPREMTPGLIIHHPNCDSSGKKKRNFR